MRLRALGLIVFVWVSACAQSEPEHATVVVDAGATTDGAASVSDGDAAMALETSADGGEAVVLFDGTLTDAWRMSTIRNQPGRDDPGHFTVEDGALIAHAGTDLGLLWHSRPTPPSFLLELEWRLSGPDDNSGVFIRFPDPDSKGYDNTAWVAIDFGFEVQINEPGFPDGAPEHTTGSIYGEKNQSFSRVVAKPPGEWNAFAIRAEGDVLSVSLNGQPVTRFENPYPVRGKPSAPETPTFIGLQTHAPGTVAFRNIRIRPL